MPYSELIKNFNKIRDYMREFYVFGFKRREEYDRRSSRTYDDEKRRIENWLSDYMQFRNTADGKQVYLLIDSRSRRHNPFYKAFKAKSFTDGDITLHFILMDILADTARKALSPEGVPDSSAEALSPSPLSALAKPEASADDAHGLSLAEIVERIDDYLLDFPDAHTMDTSTIRKKLQEYEKEGIVISEMHGKTKYYRRAPDPDTIDPEALHYFSEVAPCGVIGATISDKQPKAPNPFVFKHHYITAAMDSEILCDLFLAIRAKHYVTVESFMKRSGQEKSKIVVPLQIRASVQSGRQYLMAYAYSSRNIVAMRTDSIVKVKDGDVCLEFDQYRKQLDKLSENLWGVSLPSGRNQKLEHVSFTVRYKEEEDFIHQRLVREKRCGRVTRIDACTSRFEADVYDAGELVPWVRTFIGRLTEVHFSNETVQQKFMGDIYEMAAQYGLVEKPEVKDRPDDAKNSECPKNEPEGGDRA